MRLISQNGEIDCSYDNGALSIGCTMHADGTESARVYYHNISAPKRAFLAEYKSKGKAIKAMQMLREEYKRYDVVSNGVQGLVSAFVAPKVFWFPKDEDLEV